MHVYHYAPYEVTAMRKLMGRHASREDQVDTLLRRGVFVDLYRVVRQGILFGDDSYSIKRVEKLYFEGRKAAVKDAASSIVFYAEWMGSGEPEDWRALFDRLGRTPAELVEDMNCLGGIVRTDTPAYPVKRSTALEYRFDPNQDTKIGAGSEVIIRENRAVKATVESFDAEGLLVFKLGPSAIRRLDDEPLPGVISLLPSEYVSAVGLKESIERLVIQW